VDDGVKEKSSGYKPGMAAECIHNFIVDDAQAEINKIL
jgi:hypothetical protein